MDKTEARDLLISYLTISIAFAIVLGKDFLNIADFTAAFPISLIAVGTGFILHELAHRQAAKHYGAHAEYRAWNIGLVIALASSFFGFIFAAPGAVYISGENIDKRQNGIISIAGPAVNIAIAVLFLFLGFVSSNVLLGEIAGYGFIINLWLAFFNLLPIPPLDGSKVFIWNPLIWAVCFVPLGAIIFLR